MFLTLNVLFTGPELMDSAQEVLKSMGVPIDFEELHFSEVTSTFFIKENSQANFSNKTLNYF